jgi:hypothetical protein
VLTTRSATWPGRSESRLRISADERRHLDDRAHVQLAAPVQGRVVERAARLAKPGVGLRPRLRAAQPSGKLRRVEVDLE